MPGPILSLHHVTATSDHPQADVDFFAGALGLRLLKQTVNFDNPFVYHLYYGDERGTPGTIWTTFPYHGHGVRRGRQGSGQITATALSVPTGSSDAWIARLERLGSTAVRIDSRFGDEVVAVTDPSGLVIELVATDADARTAWLAPGIPASQAARGVHSLTMTIASPEPTIAFMTSVLGFEIVDAADRRTRLAVGGRGPGHLVDVLHDDRAPVGVNGTGTVHHMAMAVATSEDQLRMRQEIADAGVPVTNVRDREYFTSIYFREPGGVLFEIATAGPGFAIDEPLDALGQSLKLPPWEEANRSTIAAALPPISLPR
jgi:glyoxalase family protein